MNMEKKTYRRFADAHAPRSPIVKNCILAFLFGPLYYLAKGMWRRAISYTLLALIAVTLIVLLLDASGYGEFARFLAYGAAGVFAMRANLDFYKSQVLGDNGWL